MAGDASSPFNQPLRLAPPPPPPPLVPTQKSNLPMLYYGLVVVGTAALVLAIYNFVIIKWCAHRHEDQSGRIRNQLVEVTTMSGQSSQFLNQDLLTSFKYKKGSMGAQDKESDYECSVCLSAFEEGEEVRVLPRCKHSFHAPCIDMWLYSHSDCPLCRAHVGPPTFCRRYLVVSTPSVNSRQGLLGLPA